MAALASRGHHVLYVNTRYRGNDTALILEKCVLDLGAGIRDAKKRFGYERFVLGGWSGGARSRSSTRSRRSVRRSRTRPRATPSIS